MKVIGKEERNLIVFKCQTCHDYHASFMYEFHFKILTGYK